MRQIILGVLVFVMAFTLRNKYLSSRFSHGDSTEQGVEVHIILGGSNAKLMESTSFTNQFMEFESNRLARRTKVVL